MAGRGALAQHAERGTHAGQENDQGQHRHPGGGEFDGQRQSVEAGAQGRNRCRVGRREGEIGPPGACTLEEQCHCWDTAEALRREHVARVGERQGLNGVDLLIPQSQRHTASYQDLEPRAGTAKFRHKLRSV